MFKCVFSFINRHGVFFMFPDTVVARFSVSRDSGPYVQTSPCVIFRTGLPFRQDIIHTSLRDEDFAKYSHSRFRLMHSERVCCECVVFPECATGDLQRRNEGCRATTRPQVQASGMDMSGRHQSSMGSLRRFRLS